MTHPGAAAQSAHAAAEVAGDPGGVLASSYDDPGPYAVGWKVEALPFGSGTLKDRVYYPAVAQGVNMPADPSGGPFPLVALIHGATVGPADYDVLSIHVASHGYVVASLGAMTLLQETYDNLASETKTLIDWMVAESGNGTSWYAGLVWDGDFGVIASSRGGGAAELLVGLDARVRAVAEMEPSYLGTAPALFAIADWDGAWLFTTGSLDTNNPPAEVKQILDKATAATRRVYVELQGAGHAGALDPDTPGLPTDPMSHDQQLALHERLVLAFLEAQLRGDEDAYYDIVGGGAAADPLVHESYCASPPLWVIGTPGAPSTVAFGLAGTAGDLALVAVSPGTAAVPTQYGTFLLDPGSALVLVSAVLDSSGTVEVAYPVMPASVSGLAFFAQALASHPGGGAFSHLGSFVVP